MITQQPQEEKPRSAVPRYTGPDDIALRLADCLVRYPDTERKFQLVLHLTEKFKPRVNQLFNLFSCLSPDMTYIQAYPCFLTPELSDLSMPFSINENRGFHLLVLFQVTPDVSLDVIVYEDESLGLKLYSSNTGCIKIHRRQQYRNVAVLKSTVSRFIRETR